MMGCFNDVLIDMAIVICKWVCMGFDRIITSNAWILVSEQLVKSEASSVFSVTPSKLLRLKILSGG